jgi:tetratricopeptide (TPR) repeat protein
MGALGSARDHRLDDAMSEVASILARLRMALARRDVEGARAAAREALALAPDDADALAYAGLTEASAGNLAAARDCLGRAVARAPGHAFAWRNLAAVEEALGNASASAAALVQSLAAIPKAPIEAWVDAASRALAAGRPRLAGTALAIDPAHREALRLEVVRLDAEARTVDSQVAAERLLALAPEDPAALAAFAAVWSKAATPAGLARGLEAAEKLLARMPAHAGALESAAWCLHKLGDQEAAIARARAAVSAAPQVPSCAETLAVILDRANRLDEAREVLDAARARFPSAAVSARLRSRVRLRLGDFEGALEDARAALAMAPGDQEAIAFAGIALAYREGAEAMRNWLGLPEVVTAIDLPTPEGFADSGSFHAALAADIRGHSRLRFEPVGLVARRGWLTEDLLADRTPAIVGFERVLRAAIETHRASCEPRPGHPFFGTIPGPDWQINVWATRCERQGVIDTHLHVESWLSGAYYVALPPALGTGGDAGWLEFNRPPPDLPPVPESAIDRFEPRVGRLYLFPSYLYHRTLPFDGEGERISISFDLAAAPG